MAAEADSIWNRELARVTVESDDTTELRKFYTAMYHVMILLTTFNDYGSAPAYTILSLWDTYRTHLPLLSIIDRERSAEIVNSMIDLYEKEGHLLRCGISGAVRIIAWWVIRALFRWPMPW